MKPQLNGLVMSNQIYFSHSFACDQADTDLLRRYLKESGYEVIEHTGPWGPDSMKKFLSSERKLFFTPDLDIFIGRGQAEMIENAFLVNSEVFVINDFTYSPSRDKIIKIQIVAIDDLIFTRRDMKLDWAEIDFVSYSDVNDQITAVWPVLNTSFNAWGEELKFDYNNLFETSTASGTRVKPMLATVLLD